MEDVDGHPCLRVMAIRAIETGQPVFVTLPALDHPRGACLSDLGVTLVPVPDASNGMSCSLKRGFAALQAADVVAAMVLPADMPDIETGDMVRMIADFHAAPCDALQGATASGALGHPTLIAAEWSDRIQTLTGDKGAAKLIAALQDTRSFTLDSDRARLDLDTPEDWAKWRARQRR